MELFKPIDGRCPYCGAEKINIIESTMQLSELDRNGIVVNLASESYELVGYCDACKQCVYVEPDDNGVYKVYPYEYSGYSHMIDTLIPCQEPKVVHNATVHPDPAPSENAFYIPQEQMLVSPPPSAYPECVVNTSPVVVSSTYIDNDDVPF